MPKPFAIKKALLAKKFCRWQRVTPKYLFCESTLAKLSSPPLSLFVAVIVDNLARTQALANATKPKKLPGLHKKVSSKTTVEFPVPTGHCIIILLFCTDRDGAGE